MRAIVVLILLSLAVNCHADDPLESLNTVEDTLRIMEQTLDAQAWDYDRERSEPGVSGNAAREESEVDSTTYFVSYDKEGTASWVRVWPCHLEEAASALIPEFGNCAPPVRERMAEVSRFWKSRVALPDDLQPGVLVVARDLEADDAWVVAKITDLSELGTGYVGITAPFKAPLQGLRVVEE